MISYRFEALDTLFFRDGRPFNAGETGQMEVEGVFPPGARTIIGATRAAMARQLGWDGHSNWGQDIIENLGDFDNLAPLAFSGPYLILENTSSSELLFPVPLHILAEEVDESTVLTNLSPSSKTQALLCDISDSPVRLPTSMGKGLKPLEGSWLKASDMIKALSGDINQIREIKPISRFELWRTEDRVGIHRHDASRITKDDALYNIQHIRPSENLSIGLTIRSMKSPPKLEPILTLGGESRMAYAQEAAFSLPEAAKLKEHPDEICYTVTLITPAKFSDDGWRTPGKSLCTLPGKVVSACTGKSVMNGGWDSRKSDGQITGNRPIPLEPFVPAGSTWFIKAVKGDVTAAKEKTTIEEIRKLNGQHIGEKTAWGYGQILIGSWEDK